MKCKALIISDRSKDLLLTNGFIRRIFNTSSAGYLPDVIVKFIGQFVRFEFAHLFGWHIYQQFPVDMMSIHWKINLDLILQCQNNF